MKLPSRALKLNIRKQDFVLALMAWPENGVSLAGQAKVSLLLQLRR
jgi:hypothetical protein